MRFIKFGEPQNDGGVVCHLNFDYIEHIEIDKRLDRFAVVAHFNDGLAEETFEKAKPIGTAFTQTLFGTN